MKPFRVHPASCSCTGCIYQSRSKEPNVQQVIQGGYEIDKLYYGNFLPLRERKLLEKLIKARDIYDDVRNQLLSSVSSDKIEYKKKRRYDYMSDKSSRVLKMVDLVDRGKMGSGFRSKLSSCCSCSCCSCSSCETLRKIRRRIEKDKKKHPSQSCCGHIVTCEDIAKYCAEAEERGRKRRRKLSSKVSLKVGATRLKMKNHLSEPVISSVSMHASKVKKTTYARKVEAIDQGTENLMVLRKPRKIVKNIESSTTKYSGTKLKSPIAFKNKKDSIILFKEKLLKKQTCKENQDVECEPCTCEEDTCMSEECLRTIKDKSFGVTKKGKSHSRHSDTGRDRSYVLKSVSKKPRETYEKRTKSASSMALIPKLKAKAILTTTDEKATSKSRPKSDIGHIKCECKPSTKSAYSLASLPQKKVSRSVPKIMHELSRKKSRRESLYNLDEADLQEVVKATREKHVKPTHGRIKQHKKHRHGNMQSKESQESHLRESASQAAKFYHGNLYRSKHNKSKSAESFVRKTKSISKKPTPERVKENIGAISSHPDEILREQMVAIKISSSFSFGIKFYKDTCPDECCECEEKVDKKIHTVSRHPKKIKQKEHRSNYNDHGTGYVSSKDHGTGHTLIRPRHNISSQSSSSRSSINIQVGHILKQCYCTQKSKEKMKKIKHAASKKTMTPLQNKELEMVRKKQTQTKLAGIAYVVLPATDVKHGSRETNTAVTPKESDYTSQLVSKTTSRKIQSRGNRKIKQKGRHSQSPNIESKVLSDTSGRQVKFASDKYERHCAVRIGSSLSFGIEFSKSNMNCDTENVFKSDMTKRRERKHLHQKEIKAHKPQVRHETSETNEDVKAKQTHTKPFLQRCLCTPKLTKQNKKKVEKLSPWRKRNEYVMHMKNNTVTINRAEIRYNHEQLKRIPYEYGADICISKEFDPYYCKNLTKLGQVKLQQYKNIGDIGYQPTFNKTIISSKSRNTQSLTRQSYQKVKKIKRNYNYCSGSKLRVLQVASNLSNSVINKQTHNKDNKMNTIVCQGFKCPAHYKSIHSEASCKEKESSVFSVIKRIFRTSRRKLSKISHVLSGHEGVLNPCITGICDSYKCNEYNKRRDSKAFNNCYVNTNKRERKSTMSITTSGFSGSTCTKSTQSRLLKHKTAKDENVRDKQKYLKAAASFSPSRQSVRKGSNFSFNKDISRNRLVSFIQDTKYRESNRGIKNRTKKYNTVSEISTINTMKNKFRKEVKASNVGFLLKRCLCTLGLQKKNLPKSEFRGQQPITQFVQLQHNKNKINIDNITKSARHVPDKALYGEEPLKSKLPKGGYLFRENLIGNQNSMKHPHPQHLPSSNSYSKRPHIRSSININFSKMKSLLNIQKVNPFYKSFYALNVRVSKSKNKSHDKYRAFNDKECESYNCDPSECSKRKSVLKRMNPELKRNKSELKHVKPTTPSASRPTDCYERCRKELKHVKTKTPSVSLPTDCYERCKKEFVRKRRPQGQDKPLVLGSDLSFRAGVYTDKNPYKNNGKQAVRLGSDVSVNFDFFKEPYTRTIWKTGPTPKQDIEETKRRQEPIPEITVSKASILPHLLQKCLCSSKLKEAGIAKSDNMTGPVPKRDRKVAKLRQEPSPEETYSKASVISHLKCLCSSKFKEASISKSDNKTGPVPKHDRNVAKRRQEPSPEETHSKASVISVIKSLCSSKLKENGITKSDNKKCPVLHFYPVFSRKVAKRRQEPSIEETDSNASVISHKKCLCSSKFKEGGITKSDNKMGPVRKQSKKVAKRRQKPSLEEADSNASFISHIKCLCSSKLKEPGITKSGTNGRQVPKGLSTTQKLKKQNLKSKSVPSKYYIQQEHKHAHGKDKNKVTFCTSVNCLLFEQAQKRSKRKRWRGRGDGDADKKHGPDSEEMLRKEDGKGEEKDIKIKGKTIKEKIISVFCHCKPRHRKSQSKKLRQKISMETFTVDKKTSKKLDRAEREMETIMPYSKKKFKSVDSRPKLATGKTEPLVEKRKSREREKKEETYICQCKTPEERREREEKMAKGEIKKKRESRERESGEKSKREDKRERGDKEDTMYVTPEKMREKGEISERRDKEDTICMCVITSGESRERGEQSKKGSDSKKKGEKVDTTPGEKEKERGTKKKKGGSKERRKRKKGTYKDVKNELCPVCKAKAAGEFNRKKIKAPCTCMEEEKKEKKEVPRKDTSQCPMCKQNYKKNVSRCPCCKKPFDGSEDPGLNMPDPNKPLFQMTVNKTNMRVVNKDEVIRKLGSSAKALQKAQKAYDSAKYHDSKCKCCICRANRMAVNVETRKLKPCVCGSTVCKKDWEKIKREQRSITALKIKKCVCGSNICDEESSKMPELLLEGARQAELEKEMAIRATIKQKMYQKAREKRKKEYKKSRERELRSRRESDRKAMRAIKKSTNVKDVAMIAESLIDLGTFGSKAFCDIAKYVCKGIRHPRDALSDIKDAVHDPDRAIVNISKTAEGMGFNATMKRIKSRFVKMPTTAAAIKKMESHPVSNYLVHMTDSDPTKRMQKFKTKRKTREPPGWGFECSLYMASMRKRPCLRVYYMCPWFYPHCMSLLGLWKQFMDILMFICAVLIWSPCIICMELCRGCVCCLMCQG